MRNIAAILVGLFALSWMAAGHTQQAQSHPVFSPYSGSTYLDSIDEGHQQFAFALGVAASDQAFTQVVQVEGNLSKYVYELTDGKASALEVFRNYELALNDSGANILFSCINQDCRGKDDYHLMDVYNSSRSVFLASHEIDQFASLTATLSHKGDEYYVALVSGQFKDYTRYELVVLEVAEMSTGLVSVDLIGENLLNQGKVALYGIHFDSGKADIRPESGPQLEHIQQFMALNPEVTLYVVGHTDMTGDRDFNVALSQQRAAAVVKALEAMSVTSGRLIPEGVGPLAPLASNGAEKGRAKNRRVELVIR